jgi:chemotaxis protein MotB
MTRTTTFICTVLLSLAFVSCGTNKKVAQAESRASELEAKNADLSRQVNDMQRQVSDLSAQNTSMSNQFNQYKKDCQATQEELKHMNAALDEFHDNMDELEKKIREAEADFESRGLEVYSKDGVIYVDMQDNLLYKSGSAKLSDDGKKALSGLANVLNEYPKLKVIVVGNTDTVHVKGVADNWSLSTERANGVVRILSKDYSVEPSRLTSAGKGKFNPVADNGSEEGRAKNRRTEIVLNPDWERLWQSVKKD